MASNILIKRSTGSTAPGSITFGELAITTGANGSQANAGDRLFVGDNNGAAQIVGGRYFMDMLDHVTGTLTASSAVLVDSNSKICLLYTSPSPRDRTRARMPSSA